jgi:hypothetical protein
MAYRVVDVESHSLKVEQHLKRVASGVYRLPEFQRTFVWEEDRVLKLWDSLYHGFPIGQIMLWEPEPDELPMRALGRLQVDLGTSKKTTAIVDGQQRLTALYSVLIGDIALRFDLAEERFAYGDGPSRLRLDILRNDRGDKLTFAEVAGGQFFFMRATEEHKTTYARAINHLNGVLTQRELPSQIIRDADYATVLGVFKRLNQQGEPLNQIQLTMAGISQHWPGVFRRTHDLLRRLNLEMGFDQSDDPGFVLQVWAAVHTGQHLVKHLAPESPRSKHWQRAGAEAYQSSWSQTERGIGELIEMLRRDLDLSNFKFIKGHYALSVAAHYLATHPEASEEERESIKRWLVLSLVTGRYHERAESKYGADIRATSADKTLAQLFRHRSALDPSAAESTHLALDRLVAAGSRSAYATLLYLVVRKQRAMDWLDASKRVGDELAGGGWQFHNIFPSATFDAERSRLREAIEEGQAEGDDEKVDRLERHLTNLEAKVTSLGNLAFVKRETHLDIGDRAPEDYLAEIASTPRGRAALEAQLVSLDPALWKHSAYEAFCRRRCEALAHAAKELFFTR